MYNSQYVTTQKCIRYTWQTASILYGLPLQLGVGLDGRGERCLVKMHMQQCILW